MGRRQVVLPRNTLNAGPEWARCYRLEWGIVVGERVRRLREGRGLRLFDLASSIKRSDGRPFSASYLSRLERGWATPPLWVYLELARIFEVEPGALLGPDQVALPCSEAELTLVRALREAGIDPHIAIVRLLGDRPRA